MGWALVSIPILLDVIARAQGELVALSKRDGASVRFQILGPLDVRIGGTTVRVTARREQVALATLLVEPGQAVSVERLVDAIWPDRPPSGATNQLAICISSLRRRLADAATDPIITVPPGYLVDTEQAELDANEVETHVAEANQLVTNGESEHAARQLRMALDLWRGPVLAGITSPALQPKIVRWEERRLAITEQYTKLELALGNSSEVIGELLGAVAEQPLRERSRVLLMLALEQAGRKAEALEVYADARRVLRQELGIEPGSELRSMHDAVLRGTVAAAKHQATSYRPHSSHSDNRKRLRAGSSTAAMLPSDIADFTARTEEVRHIAAVLTCPRGSAVPVTVISGAGGVGKTALAVNVAHALREQFPDGQLYADLGGTRQCPADPEQVLRWFMRSLGAPHRAIPQHPGQLMGMYRSLLSGRRVLVMLDDAGSATQIEPLLPGSPSCGVIVSTRARLTGLAGAHLVELGLLRPDECLDLLRAIVGQQRVDAERQAAEELVRHCGYLPLAVRIVGARLAAKPHWTLAYLARRLAVDSRRLDELRCGTLDVRYTIGLSYGRLSLGSRRLLQRLSARGAAGTVTPDAIRTLADSSPAEAFEAFEALVEARLLDVTGVRQDSATDYLCHDLVRLYALADASRNGVVETGLRAAPPHREP